MVYGKAEDAGGLSPAKDDNAAVRHFIRRTLPILGRVDYKTASMSSGVVSSVMYQRHRA